MPPRPKSVPSYLLHKPSGRAYVKVRRPDGSRRTVYLGVYGSEESRREYARVIGEDAPPPAPDASNPAVVAPAGHVTVAELILRFLDHAAVYYRRADGTNTSEVGEFRLALRPLNFLFGALSVAEFGGRAEHLKRVRDLMVRGYDHPDYGPQPALSRKVVNQRFRRVVRIFKWGTGEDLVPVEAYQKAAAIERLKLNRSAARERPPVGPVAWDVVERTLARLNPVVKAMVLFAWHTGCRPGEVCSIKADEIDRTGDVWLYKPSLHKMSYRGQARVVAIGPQGQAALTPFIDRPGFLFSPEHTVEIVTAAKRKARKSKVQPSQVCRKKAAPKRKAGQRYTAWSLSQAIRRACEKAGVAVWTANQLRHAFATRVRAQLGLEEAQVVLGHTTANTTEIYAEKNESLAVKVAAAMG